MPVMPRGYTYKSRTGLCHDLKGQPWASIGHGPFDLDRPWACHGLKVPRPSLSNLSYIEILDKIGERGTSRPWGMPIQGP